MWQPAKRGNARILWTALAVLAGAFGVFVLWLALLREAPTFWTYRSGYPDWFKDFVRYGFFPLMGAYFFALAILLFSLTRQRTRTLGFASQFAVLACLGFLGLAILIGVAF